MIFGLVHVYFSLFFRFDWYKTKFIFLKKIRTRAFVMRGNKVCSKNMKSTCYPDDILTRSTSYSTQKRKVTKRWVNLKKKSSQSTKLVVICCDIELVWNRLSHNLFGSSGAIYSLGAVYCRIWQTVNSWPAQIQIHSFLQKHPFSFARTTQKNEWI